MVVAADQDNTRHVCMLHINRNPAYNILLHHLLCCASFVQQSKNKERNELIQQTAIIME